ncbi:MAG: patatin-like phospholipase family protein [Elusimicrobia bacterium]|nr:patatin-like phospholipase family protein [Elusimicrobiota bacterium]
MNPEERRAWEPFLKSVPLFSGLSSSEIRRVAGKMQLLSLPKGATLYNQGEEGDALYIIASGSVRIVNPQQGPDAVVAFMGRGDVLGEVGLLTGERRSVSVRLDTTCEFLKLARQDFEGLARENPSILTHLTRLLCARLTASGSGVQRQAPGAPKLVTLNVAAGADDRLVLALHLAFSLVEQTRRRTLLLDTGPDAGRAARAVGLKPVLVDEDALRALDLNSPGSVRSISQQHPSGLDLVSLPPGVLGGRLYSGIYLFLNYLRESYDIVLASLGNDLGDVERSVLAEADLAVLAGVASARPQFRQLDAELGALVTDRGRLIETWLGDRDPEVDVFSVGARRMAIPWSDAVAERLAASGCAYRALDPEPKALKGIGRLARLIGGVQVGLALGSGAALGHSLIGILKVLEREHVPVDVVSGTSMGSLLGGFLALGMDADEMEEVAVRIDKSWVFENFLWDLTLPRSGLFAGESLLRFIRSYFGTKEFHDLDLPFACVATDIETGEEVILRSGRVAESIRASCGLPLVFSPLRLSGRYLVDGGLVAPVPIRAAAALGADILLAVNLTLPAGARLTSAVERRRRGEGVLSLPMDLATLTELALPEVLRSPSVVDVFFQMIYTMEYEIARTRTDPAHLVIQPDLRGFHWTELHRARELIELGERVAEEFLPRIKALIPFFADYCRAPLRTGSSLLRR